MAKTARAQARGRAADLRHRRRGVRARAEALIFDALTFTLATGDEEWRRVGDRDDRGHPADQARAARRAPRSSASPTCASASHAGARAVLNSVFLHHCVEAGLDMAIVNPAHITPVRRDPRRGARAGRRPGLQPPPGRAAAVHRALRGQGRGRRRPRQADPTAGMEPEQTLHWHDPAPQEGRHRGPDRRARVRRRSAPSRC